MSAAPVAQSAEAAGLNPAQSGFESRRGHASADTHGTARAASPTVRRVTIAPRRIPRDDELEPLMRCYGYRLTRTGSIAGAPASYEPEDVATAEALGWPVRALQTWTPDEIVERAIAAAAVLDENAVLAAFVAGLGSAPRGRQTVISYAWARHLTPDADCGIDGPREVDVTERLLRLALGWSWNELPAHYLPDLEAAAAEGLPQPTDDDRARLRTLLDAIRTHPGRASELEKAVARAKVVRGSDKFQRYGVLLGLGELGVMPHPTLAPSWDRFVPFSERVEASRAAPGGPRSDVPVPLAGWTGEVDETRAARLLAL